MPEWLELAAAALPIACTTQESEEVAEPNPEKEGPKDPTVKYETGPFGEGEPILLAGYDYSRVKPSGRWKSDH